MPGESWRSMTIGYGREVTVVGRSSVPGLTLLGVGASRFLFFAEEVQEIEEGKERPGKSK